MGRDPSDYEVTAPVLLVWLLENDFKPVMRYDRRAQRIIDQIAAEYVGYRSGTIGSAPLGNSLFLFATEAAVQVPQLVSTPDSSMTPTHYPRAPCPGMAGGKHNGH